ncbi:triple tyrosine motif-containing protein [Dysgonomonas sp. HGC4]|uniref:triple tyrosine motif-containing protein n=1 Tax=Dysgonomonas sp. HGC4 TaxID=1658009 RepID=UPI0006808C0A|nr:triple tyrosine motif-containing protein [Dysgonomonas sp. HGC4]MBD8349854.1 hypothetical protein [Dysgonomonas sp. HGC4]
MRYRLYIIYGLLLFSLPTFASWQRNIINHERNTYKGGFQNWMVEQADNQWMYFANTNGLLEFDGVNWNLYPIKNKIVRSVEIAGKRIYVGGSSEFGYFEANSIGLPTYHSLSDKLSNWWGEVWSIYTIDNQTYFLDDGNILIYNNSKDTIEKIATNYKIDCSTLINNKVYLGTTDGIFFLNHRNKIELLAPSEVLKGKKIVELLPYDNKILVVTARSGLYLLDNSWCENIHSIADNFIAKNQLFCASLAESQVALGSVQNGVFLFDLKKKDYHEEFNLANGLSNNTVLSSTFDRNNNLWLGLDKGISYIDLQSPIRPMFAINSPIGTGYCSALFNNELYLGTNQGLYKMDKNGGYQLIKDSEGQIWSLTIYDNTLFCGGDNGITVISAQSTYKINLTGIWEIHPLASNPNRMIAGAYSGFRILEKKNGIWQFSHNVANFFNSSRGFIEDEINNTFWVVNMGTSIQRITLNSTQDSLINRKEYNLKDIIIGENTTFRKIDNNLVICALDGIYQYSRISDNFDRYAQLEKLLDGSKYYEYLKVDELKNIWYVSDKSLKLLPYGKDGYNQNTFNIGLANDLISGYENVTLLDSVSAIVAVDKAFVKVDLSSDHNRNTRLNIAIRKLVATSNDSTLFYGNSSEPITIPYSLNSINIHFAATEYSKNEDILYSYRLKEIDDKWSTPAPKTIKEYTNLIEGEYTFEVKAIIKGDSKAGETTYIKFKILSPWYRSMWAWIVYGLFLLLLSYIIYKRTIGKQKKIINEKGELLIAQSKQYEEERMLKDKKIYELQNENLKTKLHYKTQELSGYILNIVRKNEMLEDVRKNVMSISKSLDENKQPNIIKQKVVRLITQINNNIDHDKDFEVFQSNFNLIHKDLFTLLDNKYPHLTRNDKILCAYLKMNLTSKEIAPLLNISIRGVEVSRYRLRKKMNLDKDLNLSDFLHNLK